MKPPAETFHLFVLWRKARAKRSRILEDMGREFDVLEKREVRWPWWKSPLLLRAFYRDRRWVRWFRKAMTCGAWRFECVLVRDKCPRFATEADKGYALGENMHVHDVKQRYREWTGGRWRIHSSGRGEETNYQYEFLFGKSLAKQTFWR